MPSIRLSVALSLLPFGVAVASAPAEPKSAEPKPAPADVVDTAARAKPFSTWTRLITEAGLVEMLKRPGPYTVFAPTDEAFAKVPADKLGKLAADRALLRSVLLRHVVPGKYEAANLKAGKTETAAAGTAITIKTDGGVTVDGAKVVRTDLICGNGVIHAIDAVLLK